MRSSAGDRRVTLDQRIARLESALDSAGETVSEELLDAFAEAARLLTDLRRERKHSRRDPWELALERRAWAAYARANKPVGVGRGAVSSVGVLVALQDYARQMIAEAALMAGQI